MEKKIAQKSPIAIEIEPGTYACARVDMHPNSRIVMAHISV